VRRPHDREGRDPPCRRDRGRPGAHPSRPSSSCPTASMAGWFRSSPAPATATASTPPASPTTSGATR
jgi:hypothetical protein